MRNGIPGGKAAAPRPHLYGFQDRLWLVAKDPAVKVNEEKGRFLAKSNAPGRPHRHMRAVLLRKKTIPDSLSHGKSPFVFAAVKVPRIYHRSPAIVKERHP